jgi:Ca2+-binding RTX toxin-like protein
MAFIPGTPGNDNLVGTAENDLLQGRGGADTIDGRAGFDYFDVLDAGSGVTANLTSGDGGDTLISVEGIRGSNFDDRLTGDSGFNRLRGMLGNDVLDGGPGFDFADYFEASGPMNVSLVTNTSSGPDGNDTLINIEAISGSRFNDVLIGNDAENQLRGEKGDDYLDGGGGMDGAFYRDASGPVTVNLAAGTATGADGNDTLVNIESAGGSRFDDTLIGDDKQNFLVGFEGNDRLVGGAGPTDFDFDYASYISAPGGVIVNLATGTSSGPHGADTFEDIEGIQGSDFDDQLTGDSGGNRLRGMLGNDVLDGGAGFDLAVYWDAAGPMTVSLVTNSSSGPDGNDTLINIEGISGSQFTDVLIGNDEDNQLRGEQGDDFLDGGAGSDAVFYFDARGPVTVNLATGTATGADGNDTFVNIENVGGSNFDDTLIGDDKQNFLQGFYGNDRLIGGAAPTDLDLANYFDAPSGVTVNLASGTSSGPHGADTFENIDGIQGSNFDDTLTGDGNVNALIGRGGNDRLDGGGNVDTVSYTAAPGSVTVDLAAGTATGDGNDTLISIEAVRGSRFDDTLLGDAGANILSGEAGDDRLDGRGGDDIADYRRVPNAVTVDLNIQGTPQNTGSGSDTLVNMEGIRGSEAFGDTLIGNAADNVFRPMGGDDRVDGGRGNDTVWYAEGFYQPGEVTIDLGAGRVTGAMGTDRLTSIENARGTVFDDKLLGSCEANELRGEEGNDSIDGRAGNDLIDGGEGNDTLNGGCGDDTVFGRGGNDTLIASIGRDTLDGGDGDDTFNVATLGVYNTKFVGGAGIDIIVTTHACPGPVFLESFSAVDAPEQWNGAGRSIYGTANGNTLEFTNTTLIEVPYVFGAGGNDTMRGSAASADSLRGGNGDDRLYGNGGNDTLCGDGGNDTLDGGEGADSLSGGWGADTFLLSDRASADTIADFVSGTDKFNVSQAGIRVGDGDLVVEGGTTVAGPGGFMPGAELVIVSSNIAGAVTASSAADAIGSATSAYEAGATALFAVDNGRQTGLFLFTSSGADALVSETELTLLATASATPATVLADYWFVT